MKTRALAALLPLLALAGCTDDDNVSIQVYAMCLPPDDECAFEAECAAYNLGQIALDVSQTSYYWSFIEVRNQMARNEDPSAGRPNTKDAYVDEITVEYVVPPNFPAALQSLPRVTERLDSGPVRVPAEGSAVVGIYPIVPSIGAALRANLGGQAGEVVARVRMRGLLDDQTEFETAEFPIPVQVCAGCLGLPGGCDDPATPEVEPTTFCPPNVGQSPIAVICE